MKMAIHCSNPNCGVLLRDFDCLALGDVFCSERCKAEFYAPHNTPQELRELNKP